MVLYGICNLSCQIQIFPNFLDINVDLSSGILVEIVDTQTEKYGIRIPKLSNTTTIQQSDFYLCAKDRLIIISEDMVPFLMAITDLNLRVSLARRSAQVDFIRTLKVGHIAAVYGTLFNERKYFECRVKYIGPVPELGPGKFIGVEFMVNYFRVLYFHQIFNMFFFFKARRRKASKFTSTGNNRKIC